MSLRKKFMKVELKLVLKTHDNIYEILNTIKNAGFDATIISSESLKDAVDFAPGDSHFMNVRQLEQNEFMERMFCFFVVDESRLDELKTVIREATQNFTTIKGFMYSRKIEDFEGSIK